MYKGKRWARGARHGARRRRREREEEQLVENHVPSIWLNFGMVNVIGHISQTAPDPVRSPKLSWLKRG